MVTDQLAKKIAVKPGNQSLNKPKDGPTEWKLVLRCCKARNEHSAHEEDLTVAEKILHSQPVETHIHRIGLLKA